MCADVPLRSGMGAGQVMRAGGPQATEDKNAAMAQAERTANKARLADRLINGLAGEFQRWTQTIKQMTIAEGARLTVFIKALTGLASHT